MTVPWGDVLETKARLESHFSSVKVWDRDYGNYQAPDFGNANIVVFMLPENKFGYPKNLLPPGVRKDLELSIMNGKKMYIAYTTKMGRIPSIYEARMNSGVFEAICGTAESIYENPKHRVPTLEEKLKAAAEQIAINSRYGVATSVGNDKTWTTDQGVTHRIHTQNSCEEAASPLYLGKKKYVHTIVWKDYDERLLLMM